MSRTLLEEVNAVLKKGAIIQGSTGELTTLTDSALQVDIDIVVKAWNRALLDLARTGIDINVLKEGTLTLVTATDEYAVETDFVEMAPDTTMIDETNGTTLTPYPGGFMALRQFQTVPANFTGLPYYWTINPTNNNFKLDNKPTAAENGRAYKYLYKKTILVALAADTIPLRDDATEAMEDAVTQLYARSKKGQFDQQSYQLSIASVAQIARQMPLNTRYGVVRY